MNQYIVGQAIAKNVMCQNFSWRFKGGGDGLS